MRVGEEKMKTSGELAPTYFPCSSQSTEDIFSIKDHCSSQQTRRITTALPVRRQQSTLKKGLPTISIKRPQTVREERNIKQSTPPRRQPYEFRKHQNQWDRNEIQLPPKYRANELVSLPELVQEDSKSKHALSYNQNDECLSKPDCFKEIRADGFRNVSQRRLDRMETLSQL